ncbi:hypothetical protein D3C78_986010 [compost metagenome]
MQIGDITGRGFAGIDNHHLQRRIGGARLHQPLIKHRMRPGGIRPHQHHQIGLFDIVVAARHDIFTKRALIAGHGR